MVLNEAHLILNELVGPPATSKGELRARIFQLLRLEDITRDLAEHQAGMLIPESTALWRILSYLRLFEGEEIGSQELNVVSGIQEHGRRVRELRVEYGFAIETIGKRYRLNSSDPDLARVEIWRFMNELRNEPISITDAWGKLFIKFPGQPITKEQLHYVRPGADLRRVRELRTDKGYRIMSRFTGRPDLKPTQYVLVDTDLLPESDRDIKESVQIVVLERDKFACRKTGCSWRPSDRVTGDPRQYIEIHHIRWHVHGGNNDAVNLATLCNVHHKEVHRDRIYEEAFPVWLSTQ